LSADPANKVLLLEYGGSDRSIFIQMPSALSIPMNMPRYNWFYHTEPEPHLNGRRIHTPRGKVLGGSSSINGLVYIRGNPEDFEHWQALGARGWGYGDVLPYFKRAERREEGGDRYRGAAGQLRTRYGALRNPLHAAWLEAAAEAGYPRSSDVNGFQQEGFGRMDMTVGGGRRWSAANAYLRPVMHRSNLKVMTHALATRIAFEGKRAVALEYKHDGAQRRVRVSRELIVCGGPINSPQLLKLSGVGPEAELREQGIPVVRHLAGVGENLQDHLEFYFQVACREPITLYSSINILSRALIGARWLLRKERGVLRTDGRLGRDGKLRGGTSTQRDGRGRIGLEGAGGHTKPVHAGRATQREPAEGCHTIRIGFGRPWAPPNHSNRSGRPSWILEFGGEL